MKILIAEYSGFCFGVKRAVNILESLMPLEETVYTLGPIIHNQQVTNHYSEKGVQVIDALEDISVASQTEADVKVVIRSHGAPKSVYDQASTMGIKLLDATCPYVKKIQNTVSSYASKRYNIIIVGNSQHPEVIGINGWCDNKAEIVETLEHVMQLSPSNQPTCVVVQTTFSIKLWDLMIEAIRDRIPEATIFNTICLATEERQKAVLDLAAKVDLMVVVGGKHSSNTKKLAELCAKQVRTIHIETKDDLNGADLIGTKVVGITAGASTPDWIIQSVILKIENEGEVIF